MREVLVGHEDPVQICTGIRSTVLQSSIASLRQRGHFEEWSALIDPVARQTLLESLAPTWMEMSVALAHYAACEALRLPNAEQVKLGESVGDRIQGTFMATLMKTARAAGLDPVVLLRQFDRMMKRVLQGGSVQVVQTGLKDVEIELRGVQLPRFSYFRTGMCGVVKAGFLFAGVRTVHVKQISYTQHADSFMMHAAWV